MKGLTIGLFFSSWDPRLASKDSAWVRNPMAMYKRAFWFKANPRDSTYMRSLFAECYAEGKFIDIALNPFWKKELVKAGTVVLLYPDAIGQGFWPIEKEVIRLKENDVKIMVLNGRRRQFGISSQSLLSLRIRRFLERWMVGEVIALCFFSVITPLFLLIDTLQGRK